MNFQESVEYLYSLGYELSVKKFGLENTIKLLAALKNPENEFLKIQVAGTNGKGSTCAFLDSICAAAGIKTGLYTSPHLVSITERIKVGGEEISEEDFARHATEVRDISELLVAAGELETEPTFFEQVTAIALNYFAEQKIKLAILETGLGGRFDATTATRAQIAAFTPIDFDHQNILGETIREIASEKAAIIGENTFVVFVSSQPQNEAFWVIWERCREFDLEPISVTANLVESEFSAGDLINSGISFKTEFCEFSDVTLSLPGKHQFTNAVLALTIADYLLHFGFNISTNNIIEGLKTAKHKGRLEYFGGILFDGAHNTSGALALKDYLDEAVDRPIVMIFGAMKDKDLTEIASILFPKAEKLILTTPDNPRSMKAEDLTEFVPASFPKENVFIRETVAEALQKAREISSGNDLILITGSLYLIGEAQKILKNQSEI